MTRSDTTTANGHGAKPITRADLESKLREITGGATETVEAARGIGVAIAAAAGVVVLVGAYWLGRRKGRKRQTVLEIRRI